MSSGAKEDRESRWGSLGIIVSLKSRIGRGHGRSRQERKMNFSEREVEIIVEGAGTEEAPARTTSTPASLWLPRVRRGAAHSEKGQCSGHLPRGTRVKKKWSDLKTEVRRKVAQVRAAVEGKRGPRAH